MKNLILMLAITSLSLSCTRGRDTYYLPEIKVVAPTTNAAAKPTPTKEEKDKTVKTDKDKTEKAPTTAPVNTEPVTETEQEPGIDTVEVETEVTQPRVEVTDLPKLPQKNIPEVKSDAPRTLPPMVVMPSTNPTIPEQREYLLHVGSSNHLKDLTGKKVETSELIWVSKHDENRKITIYKDDKRELYILSDGGYLSYHTIDLENGVELAPASEISFDMLGSFSQKYRSAYYAHDEIYSNLLSVSDVSKISDEDLAKYEELDAQRVILKAKVSELAKDLATEDAVIAHENVVEQLKKVEEEISVLCSIVVALALDTNP